MPTSADICARIIDAILAGRLSAGTRLGEQSLVQLFGVSRTIIREALIRLETRGIVQVSSKRGWFIIEPSVDEARMAFHARRAIEIGLLQTIDKVAPSVIGSLRAHIGQELDAIHGGDIAARSYLLGDFHVCMAEALGNPLLAELLRDLTARTVLISMLYQSTHDATVSCNEHAHIVSALEAGDLVRASHLMGEHIGNVEAGLSVRSTSEHDPLENLRRALEPLKPQTLRRRET